MPSEVHPVRYGFRLPFQLHVSCFLSGKKLPWFLSGIPLPFPGYCCEQILPACSNPLYRRAIRVSMGTVFQIPWTFVDNSVSWPEEGIQLLHKMGFKMAALALSGDSIRIDDPILQKEMKNRSPSKFLRHIHQNRNHHNRKRNN